MRASLHLFTGLILIAARYSLGQESGSITAGEVLEPLTHVSTGSCAEKGNSIQHYLLAETGTEMPYHMYVPTRYDGHTPLPVIVMLHGRSLDENSPFVGANGLLVRLADEHGYIIVSPLGFRKDAGFGQRYHLVIDGKEVPSDVDDRTARLSELDVMSVVHRVLSECKVDGSRIYLAGHSMGGLGAWYLGAKYSEMWAGIAVMAAGVMESDYPLRRLKGIPFMLSQGTEDVLSKTEDARTVLHRMEASGLAPVYLEIQGASHSATYDKSLGAVFDFFDEHRRTTR
jgi:predicted peptidase